MKNITNNIVAIMVVVIVLMLIIPIPPVLVDVFIILNISISMIILLITMNIKGPLEFSIFPSLLLITTLFRIGINVSTTRNILGRGGNSGGVIKSIGDFVLGGNLVVGFVIFIIIVMVQFIVITKGAERVAEVAARFTLDAMPGKQMAIDADLSAGLIDEQQAKERRLKIQREADFYGAMDGATKIVKGDAIMSIIITLVNFIGGMIIGVVMGKLALSDSLHIYALSTVGDGLASQLPSLMISTATGMIVTRSVSEGSLNDDVSKQFTVQPHAFLITGILMALVSFMPGMPKIQFFIVSAAMVVAGVIMSRKITEAGLGHDMLPLMDGGGGSAATQTAPPAVDDVTDEGYFRDVNNIYSLINVEPIEMEFGYSLIPLVDENSGGKMINRIVIFRRQYAQDMGFVVPSVRLRDSAVLNTNQYVIKIKGEEIASGEILVDYMLALEPASPAGELDGIETIEPAYGIPSKWITADKKELAEIYGYTVIDPLSVMIMHLSETIKKHSYELLTRSEVMQLLENVKKSLPDLVDEVFPNIINYSTFQKILVALLKEGIPIKDMETILESIADSAASAKDIEGVIENIRIELKRTITRKFSDDGQMRVITLDAELEKAIVTSLTKGDDGYYMALNPDIVQSIVEQFTAHLSKFTALSQTPTVLTSQVVRTHLYKLLDQFFPGVTVLSFNEIASNVSIQSIGNITVTQDNDG